MSKNQTIYTDAFRRNAVDLFINSGKPATEVAGAWSISVIAKGVELLPVFPDSTPVDWG